MVAAEEEDGDPKGQIASGAGRGGRDLRMYYMSGDRSRSSGQRVWAPVLLALSSSVAGDTARQASVPRVDQLQRAEVGSSHSVIPGAFTSHLVLVRFPLAFSPPCSMPTSLSEGVQLEEN
ncbi:hypothetical protein HispidOSU_021554, partial [Sigmodon hispidus]